MANCKKCNAQLEEGNEKCKFCGEDNSIFAGITSGGIDEVVNNLNDTPDTTAEFDEEDIKNNKIMAILAYLEILVLVPILAAKDSKFARYHANQGLILFITSLILGIVSGVLNFLPVIGWLFSICVSFSILLLMILGIINAANGKAKELPIMGKYRILK